MMQQCRLIVRKTRLMKASPRFRSSFSSLQCRAITTLDTTQHQRHKPFSHPPVLVSRLDPSLFSRERLFSSTSTAGERSERIIDALLGTKRVGSLTPKDWKDALQAISYMANKHTKQSVDKAWEILDRLVEEAKHCDLNSAISQAEFTSVLNYVIEAWDLSILKGKAYHVAKQDIIKEAHAVLSRLDRYAPHLLPNALTYNKIISFVNHANIPGGKRVYLLADTVHFAESVLKRMYEEAKNSPLVEPDVRTYTQVMRAWANSRLPGSLKKTEALFRQMEANGVSPNTFAFNAVVHAHTKEGDSLAMRRAEVILSHMQKLDEEGIKMVKPNADTFSHIISGYAQRADQKNAEATLYRMQEYYEGGNADVKPVAHSFRQVILSWAKRRDAVGAQRAEDILKHMQRQYDEGNSDVKPDVQCHVEVINAWAKLGGQSSIRKAEAILRLLQKRYADSPDDIDGHLHVGCYIPLIAAWTRSGESSAGKHADFYLQAMKDRGIAINTRVYESAIKAWKRSDDIETKKRRIKELDRELEVLRVSKDTNREEQGSLIL